MVKLSKKKDILSQLAQPTEEEDFFLESNTYLENEALNEEAENFDERAYEDKNEEMIEKLRTIDGKKKRNLRTEIVKGEFDVNITTKHDPTSVHKIKAYELLNSLKGVSEASELKKIFAQTHKRQKVLETPLPKHVSDKALRIASYIQDKKEVSAWDPIVKRNRTAEQLVFPLKQPNYAMETSAAFTKTWNPETDLEKEISALLQTSENNIKDQKLLTPAEVRAFEQMNLEEMRQKRSEFLKLKALQSYQELKFKRMRKIKSKTYRKILRKEREKDENKSLAKMEKDDPIQFKEVLKEMEKKRMMERMSLKHKNTSKWAKQQKIYAQYSERSKDMVQEQLELSKKLTQRVKEFEVGDSSADEDAAEKDAASGAVEALNKKGLLVNNPWMKMMSGVGGVKAGDENGDGQGEGNEEEYSKPKAFSDKRELQSAQMELDEESDDDSLYDGIDRSELKDVVSIIKGEADEDEDEEESSVVNESDKKTNGEKSALEQENKPADLQDSNENNNKNKKKKKNNAKKTKKLSKAPADDNNYDDDDDKVEEKDMETINMKVLPTVAPVEPMTEPNENKEKTPVVQNNRERNAAAHSLTISEAFADDDVIEEFRAEKEAVVDGERVKAIDLTMPGWGDWAGAGIDLSKTKKKSKRNNKNGRLRRKLVIQPSDVLTTAEDKAQLVRKDADLQHVIISEKKDAKIAAYQISDLPHKFSSVAEFESKISQPVGRTWNPDYKFRKLIAPKVKTRMGAIIQPIDKDDTSRYNTKKNKQKKSIEIKNK